MIEASNERSIIFIDWDDTVLPTSWLRARGVLSNNICDMSQSEPNANTPKLPEDVAMRMKQVEDATLTLIEMSKNVAKVVFVTNSSSHWIPFTAKHFFSPKLLTALRNLEVYSARPESVERAAASGAPVMFVPSMAVQWKNDRFREIASRGHFDVCISLGDGYAERCAVLNLHNHHTRRKSVKAVRMVVQPDIETIISQLHGLIGCIEQMVRDPSSGEIVLQDNGNSKGYAVWPVESLFSEPENSDTHLNRMPSIDDDDSKASTTNTGVDEEDLEDDMVFGKEVGGTVSFLTGDLLGATPV